MRRRQQLLAAFAFLAISVPFLACSSTEKRGGLTRVDDLLTRVEQIQIESLVAREKASAAFDAYGSIVAPDFAGDPMVAFSDLVTKIEASKLQAKKLQDAVNPMKETADSVFRAWTTDLEQFGNTNLRQASQARLAETRARYSAVHDSAIAALVSINAFNSDLNDQALFLEHDFNAAAVTVVAAEVPALTNQARDLSRRLNECVATSKAYIAASSLRGQLDGPPAAKQPAVAAQPPAAPGPRKLPNPMAEDETAPEVAGDQSAPTMVAPAKRRPRPDAVAPQPGAAAPQAAAPALQPGASTPQPGTSSTTQPSSQPVHDTLPPAKPQAPKPDSDVQPAPQPPVAGGNGGAS